jgi:hypothetical protein
MTRATDRTKKEYLENMSDVIVEIQRTPVVF